MTVSHQHPPRQWWSPLEWLAAHPEVRLRVEPLPRHELGYYNWRAHEIVVDESLLPDELFDTLAHEIVHAIRRDRGVQSDVVEDQVDAQAQAMFGPYRMPMPAAEQEARQAS